MIRACVCMLVGVVLSLAAGSLTPAPGAQDDEAKSKPPQPAAPPAPQAISPHLIPPHGIPSRALMEGEDKRKSQPWRVEYSYPLKSDAERLKSVTGLQQLTVDLLALHNMYKQAHWNLTGPLFLPLHDYFHRQSDVYVQQADLFAERVLQLGASVDGRFSTIESKTKLAELPEGYLTDDHAIKLLLDRVSVLQKEVYQLIHETGETDPPTGNKLQDLAHTVDRDLWQLRAHLQKPSSRRGNLPWFSQQAYDPPGH